MVREAYRNYRHNNYLTYIFSSRDFADMARKLTNLREVASMRERKLQDIAALSKQVAEEKELLDRRKRSLDSVTLKPESPETEARTRRPQRPHQHPANAPRRRNTALQRKMSQEQQLDVAIGELRKLTKGQQGGAIRSRPRPRA